MKTISFEEANVPLIALMNSPPNIRNIAPSINENLRIKYANTIHRITNSLLTLQVPEQKALFESLSDYKKKCIIDALKLSVNNPGIFFLLLDAKQAKMSRKEFRAKIDAFYSPPVQT